MLHWSTSFRTISPTNKFLKKVDINQVDMLRHELVGLQNGIFPIEEFTISLRGMEMISKQVIEGFK